MKASPVGEGGSQIKILG